MVPLKYEEHGEGLPVLAIHGWQPDRRLMTGCLEPVFATRGGYRRLYPDLPGMGETPAGDVASSDDVLAALLAFVDERIGTAPFLVIGESYGGYLARAVARARPDQVLGLALICPALSSGEEADATWQLPEHAVVRPDPELIATLDPADRAYQALAVVQSKETLERFRAEVSSGLALADRAALARIDRNGELTVSPESGPPFRRPTLILTGRQDQVTGFADLYALLAHYPRASFAVLDRAGHNLQIEQPGLLEALTGEWLARVAEAAGKESTKDGGLM